jgi:redox-sensitive bicupin YhaK (pirin superfamily)
VGYLYLISGALSVNGEPLATGDAAKIAGPGALNIKAAEDSELILVDVPAA